MNVKESIRSILEICGESGGLAQYQIIDLLPDSKPKVVRRALIKMSKAGEIVNSGGGIIRIYYLMGFPRFSAKDYTGTHSLSMA